MKRIATIGAVITAFAVAPSLAAGANAVARANTQVSTQVVHTQVAQVRRAQTAVSIQRHLVEIKLAARFAALRPQVR